MSKQNSRTSIDALARHGSELKLKLASLGVQAERTQTIEMD
jgi:hypothetical protein